MNRIWAVVTTGEASVAGLLAGEALRSAAQARGRAIEIEVRKADGVLRTFAPAEASEPAADDVLLLVASGEVDEPRFPGVPRQRASIADVLGDAGAVLARVATPAVASIATTPAVATTRVVAVTSCPTGIAHTFMAAEGLTHAAAALGYAIRVETQGSVGAKDTLTAEEIAAADVVVIAADREVDRARFAGKRVLAVGTKRAINDGQALLRGALTDAALQPAIDRATPAAGPSAAGPYKHLMNGVSFMLPFVVSGGLLIALAFAVGGIYVTKEEGTFAHALFQIGAQGAFSLIVPALAGYIAFSIADRPGLAPGMVGGVLAASMGVGFLGGILAGFIAGYATRTLARSIKLPPGLAGLLPVLILPVLGTLVTGLAMIYVVGVPMAHVLTWLTEGLKGMQGSSAALLGLLLGGMMAVDMGGPVNKAAYAFSTGLLASSIYTPMAAVMVAGMTPPLALALATKLFPRRFTRDERDAGNAAAVLGLAFISEGAIPFAARDPLRVIPALIAGSAVAGALAMALGVAMKVPHGGLFVLPIPGAVDNVVGWVIALVAGTVTSAGLLGVLKRPLAAD
ncbi:MAG: fructose-specific PTS transporter subunit EIIC [Deltaproteobacteria bacterium]|nr:fructose-specific PTS transporter subunit EIIC [Deltaproteobacteria bacterium]